MPAEPCKDGRKLEHEEELWNDVSSAESMIISCFYYNHLHMACSCTATYSHSINVQKILYKLFVSPTAVSEHPLHTQPEP